jgi:L-lysine exporter family protein LysE/ArgO
MLEYLIQGFLLGLAYVAPIGIQNMYVIDMSLKTTGKKALQVALITVFFDVSLALACFFGVGLLLGQVPLLKDAIIIIGSIAVIIIGIRLMTSEPTLNSKVEVDLSLLTVAPTCFTVTWFNPQALIDGTLLLGSFKASLPALASDYFISGVALASLIWFSSLALLASTFKGRMDIRIMKFLNIICGAMIVFYGIMIGYGFIITL